MTAIIERTTEATQNTISPSAATLAINGGPRAVPGRVRDRWRAVRWADALPVLFSIVRGKTRDPSGAASKPFERRFAKLTGTQHALFMNSGTATLHSALFAVGVGPGDEVILPSYTYHATASAVLCCGAMPVFCDIDPNTLTADPADIRARITPRTKVILPVHVWGNPTALDTICQIASEHGIRVIEDCSHAHGARYAGRPVGSWGDVGCYSLQGAKPVSGGEAGIAVCNDPDLFDRMVALGHPVRAIDGMKKNDFQIGAMNLGPKYRPHLFAVQLATSSLKRLDQLNRLRARNWKIICDVLDGVAGIRAVSTLPKAERGGFFEFKVVLAEGIDTPTFLQAAAAEGVPVRLDRYGFLHDSRFFHQGGPLSLDMLTGKPPSVPLLLPNTESLRNRILTLPAFTQVSEGAVRQCAEGLKKVAACLSGVME
jgi:dTDP-4-amino-4,6-dideoxygalactose transaminase